MTKNKNISRSFAVRLLAGRLAEVAGVDVVDLISFLNNNGDVSDTGTPLKCSNVISAKKASGLYTNGTLASVLKTDSLKTELLTPFEF